MSLRNSNPRKIRTRKITRHFQKNFMREMYAKTFLCQVHTHRSDLLIDTKSPFSVCRTFARRKASLEQFTRRGSRVTGRGSRTRRHEPRKTLFSTLPSKKTTRGVVRGCILRARSSGGLHEEIAVRDAVVSHAGSLLASYDAWFGSGSNSAVGPTVWERANANSGTVSTNGDATNHSAADCPGADWGAAASPAAGPA